MIKTPSYRGLLVLLIITLSILPLTFSAFGTLSTPWSVDKALTSNPWSSLSPAAKGLQDGSVLVVWVSYGTGKAQLFSNRFAAGAWRGEVHLVNDSYNDLRPGLMQTRAGVIWLVYASDATGSFQIYRRTSADNGATWSNATGVTNDPGANLNPSITELQNGNLLLFWDSTQNGKPDLYYKTYNGTAWSGDTRLTTDPSIDWQPSTLQSTDGTVWVFWATNRTGNQEIFYRKGQAPSSGITWGLETPLTTDPSTNHLPSAIQNSNGTISVVWSSDRLSTVANDNIFIKNSSNSGSTWTADTVLVPDLSLNAAPSITQASDQTKTLWVVWYSSRTGNLQIFYKTNPVPAIIDIAVFGAAPARNFVYQGFIVNIGVVVENLGNVPETFQVNAYANGTLFGTQSVTLAPGVFQTISIPWNSTGAKLFATYVMTVAVPPLPGEVNISNNNATAGNVTVRLVGDIAPALPLDGDHSVDVVDVLGAIVAWGSKPGMPNWNVYADMNGDNVVDLNDVLLVIVHWGSKA